ncbi:MAG: hypothetical protein ACKO2G_03070 [Verrucomicrobiales bacterium]
MSTEAPTPEPYEAFLSAREEVMKVKWVASEKEGHDVGMEAALLEWARAGERKEEREK